MDMRLIACMLRFIIIELSRRYSIAKIEYLWQPLFLFISRIIAVKVVDENG